MATGSVSPKKGKVVDIPSTTVSIGTATDGGDGVSASVPFTPTTYSVGGPQVKYTATSNPGSFTADATASPITVSGLTAGTAYTFTVAAGNATGYNAPSAASNSLTLASPPSAFDSLATVSVGTATNTVTFSSIPSTYTHLQIRYIARSARTTDIGATMLTRFNSDSGNNYAYHMMYGNGVTAGAYNGSTTNFMRSYSVSSSSASNTQIYGAGVIDILDYANTSKYKTLRHLGGYDRNGSGELNLASGLWQSTSAISTITLTLNEATANYEPNSQFALYGIKGA
jgi:hypothetical protein